MLVQPMNWIMRVIGYLSMSKMRNKVAPPRDVGVDDKPFLSVGTRLGKAAGPGGN